VEEAGVLDERLAFACRRVGVNNRHLGRQQPLAAVAHEIRYVRDGDGPGVAAKRLHERFEVVEPCLRHAVEGLRVVRAEVIDEV
jgi:hypothetical protein